MKKKQHTHTHTHRISRNIGNVFKKLFWKQDIFKEGY